MKFFFRIEYFSQSFVYFSMPWSFYEKTRASAYSRSNHTRVPVPPKLNNSRQSASVLILRELLYGVHSLLKVNCYFLLSRKVLLSRKYFFSQWKWNTAYMQNCFGRGLYDAEKYISRGLRFETKSCGQQLWAQWYDAKLKIFRKVYLGISGFILRRNGDLIHLNEPRYGRILRSLRRFFFSEISETVSETLRRSLRRFCVIRAEKRGKESVKVKFICSRSYKWLTVLLHRAP